MAIDEAEFLALQAPALWHLTLDDRGLLFAHLVPRHYDAEARICGWHPLSCLLLPHRRSAYQLRVMDSLQIRFMLEPQMNS